MPRRVFKVHSRIYMNPVVVEAGNKAMGLFVLAGSWAAEQNEPYLPAVPASILRGWSRKYETAAAALVDIGFWEFTPERLYDEVHEAAWSFVPNHDLYVFSRLSGGRSAIPASLRERVYARDGYRCLHCGATDRLSLDHVYPYSRGGADTYSNLQTLCIPCNSSKGARV